MEKTTFENYLLERYQIEIQYYENRAARNKALYYGLSAITIIISSMTSIILYLVNVYSMDYLKIIAFLLSASVSILMAILSLYNFHEKWINYRTTSESLKKEIHYYDAKLGDYAESENPESIFVERVEERISTEHTKWSKIVKVKEK